MPGLVTLHDLSAVTIDGVEQRLDIYRGRILLVVNVASRCGYTPQYTGLEALYRRFKDQGVVVLGFPCNQFGRQEPGTPDQIRAFCSDQYQVTFPLFSTIAVNGPDAHPLFTLLKSQQPGRFGLQRIPWNFTKFLVDRDGTVLRRYGPRNAPASIEPAIARLIAC